MALRAAAVAAQPSSRSLWRLLSSRSAYPPSATAAAFAPQAVEPKSSLFVSGLNKGTTSERLLQEFSKFGKVVRTRVMIDREGCSKGYGFVQYATIEEAAKGIKSMNGKFLDGWIIFVEYAKSIPEPTQQSHRYLRQ
ncbi:organelle RRM domain-containing protein 2, mitochondrial-like isoform X1 [Arachis stenosperma]|uniref:organelle RRM domain-containing protein 2, mitochondrial-like isoform X1 n=1 Tax=Arachis stenosperma TaxID=217475 RepID=UPI0025ABA068|nr:organelle RRM domain-containing protein 2, mitochondrial-like isoform X1 [Arachis stenosperma]